MPKFKVAIEWQGVLSVAVEAPSMDDAIELVRNDHIEVPKPGLGDLHWEVDIESSYELTEQAKEDETKEIA